MSVCHDEKKKTRLAAVARTRRVKAAAINMYLELRFLRLRKRILIVRMNIRTEKPSLNRDSAQESVDATEHRLALTI